MAADVMPVFTIKAKDKLAVLAVEHYAQLCRDRGLNEQAGEVERAVDELIDWRELHPDLVKLPDHQHVPAAAGVAQAVLDLIRAQAERWAALAPADDWGHDIASTVTADCGRAILAILDTPETP